MVCCTFGKMNKGSTTEERKEFNMTTLVWFTSFLLENLFLLRPAFQREFVFHCTRAQFRGQSLRKVKVDDT